ncbi:hypothetical protein KFE25_004038 [Diacronema lutheri]|uniref:Aminotransferase class I/classII large domain-containing protein n=1 Tax=Diacronema lutheri TaxID=2081491 RepID=A0A8J5XQS5_DIALT|nr:hypothetical protein KFE25_004038 [Diacronema lutheri]
MERISWRGRGLLGVALVQGVGGLASSGAPVGHPRGQAAHRLAGADAPTVWSEFGALARETGAVNLGQGFPDWAPPQFVLEAGMQAMSRNCHQYTRTAGHPPLTSVLARRYSAHLERQIDPTAEIAVTVGASQALFLTLQALVNPGDEVLVIEPTFDLYYGQIRVAGATAVGVPMDLDAASGEWHLDMARLDAAVTARTRVLILNSPHNPTGKVFSRDEMLALADFVRAHPRLLVISDEVYKYTVHGHGSSHVHFAALPAMYDRTVTVSSAGKTFSVTGWQVGWAVGPPALIAPMQAYLPLAQFCVATPLQEALSLALDAADRPLFALGGEQVRTLTGDAIDGAARADGAPLVDYYSWRRAQYARKREALADALSAGGIRPLPCAGGFFTMGETSSISVPDEYMRASTAAAPSMRRDWALCRYLAIEHGVLLIPASPFFSREEHERGAALVRVAFCKTDETLERAAERLGTFGSAHAPAAAAQLMAARAAVRAARAAAPQAQAQGVAVRVPMGGK